MLRLLISRGRACVETSFGLLTSYAISSPESPRFLSAVTRRASKRIAALENEILIYIAFFSERMRYAFSTDL